MLEIGREKIRWLFIRTSAPTTSSTTPTNHHTRRSTSAASVTGSWQRRLHLTATQRSTFPNNNSFGLQLESCLDRYFSTMEKTTRTQINSALRRLSLKQGFSMLELRDAYFEAAKRCHPDANQDDNESKGRSSNLFLKVTEAYELLRKYPRGDISKFK